MQLRWNSSGHSAAQSITANEIANLPLDGHTALDAIYLGFAVVSQENRDANAPRPTPDSGTVTMGGAAQGANEILLDGVPDIGTQGTTGRRPAFLPPPDSVAEVKTEISIWTPRPAAPGAAQPK